MIWSRTFVAGPFPSFTGTWVFNGTAVPVPETSTYAMMLAGLGLVSGMAARRRKRIVSWEEPANHRPSSL